MTSNNNLKTQARAYAAKKGISYSQARREILEDAAALLGRIAGNEQPITLRRVLTVQQAVRADGKLPYPFHITEGGFVDRQDFWRGEPFRLIGFVEDPEVHEVDVRGREFLAAAADGVADPEALVKGMHPVFADIEGNWATYRGEVSTVTVHMVEATAPFTVQARVRSADGAHDFLVGVGHLMHLLSVDHFDGDQANGVVTDDAAKSLLGWINTDADGQDMANLEAFWNWLDDQGVEVEAVVDREGIDEAGFEDYGKAFDAAVEAMLDTRWTVTIDPREVKEWAALRGDRGGRTASGARA